MSRFLTVPIQGDGPCIHRVTWGSLCLINLKKVIGHLNMAKGEKVPCLGKASSLQVMKSWLEILDTSGSRWAYWSTPQKKLTEIFHKYKINACTGLTPPYERSRAACKTFLEASTHLPAQLDLDQIIRGWAGPAEKQPPVG